MDHRRRNPSIEIDYDQNIFKEAPLKIENSSLAKTKRYLTDFGLPSPDRADTSGANAEVSYNIVKLNRFVAANIDRLNSDHSIHSLRQSSLQRQNK